MIANWLDGRRILFFLLPALLLCISATGVRSASGGEGQTLQVYVLAGQSNMQGHAHVRTLDAMRLNPKTAPLLTQILGEDGSPRVCKNVWISSIGSASQEQLGHLTTGFGAQARGPKIGPELMFGIQMEQLVNEPILIIKTAWGGKSLNTDFRPPSAGPYQFNESQLETFRKQEKDIAKIRADKAAATGHYYRLMIEHIEKVLADLQRVYPDYDPEQGYQLAGFVWFQGWNDMVDRGTYPDRGQPGGYDQYSRLMAQLIRDVRQDLQAPELPFVIGVMGVGGPTAAYGPDKRRYQAVHQGFRDAMTAPAELDEFKGSVSAVLTEKYWDMELVQLRAREKQIKPQLDEIKDAIKAGELSREQGESKTTQLYAATFNPRELEILQQSTSNFEFHYLGSAGIMAQIGKAFAEAMDQLAK